MNCKGAFFLEPLIEIIMHRIFEDIYYQIKPFIPKQLLIALRRKYLRMQLPHYQHIWPINEKAAAPPAGWQGWPKEKSFALVLTHDVEDTRGLSKCRRLAEMEMELGFQSSFNFVAEDYRRDPELWQFLIDNGFEIGLHSLTHKENIFRSRQIFTNLTPRLNRYLKEWGSVGFRGPSMHRNLDWLHDLQILYDATTFDTDPFEPQPEGVGTIFPYWVNCPNGDGGYVELPYTLPQDFTLFILMQEKDESVWENKLDWLVQNGGMALIITHPDYMNFDAESKSAIDQYPADQYRRFLQFIKNTYTDRYWHVLPAQLANFWCKHFGCSRITNKIHLKED